MAFKKGKDHHCNKLSEDSVKSIRGTIKTLSNNYWADRLGVHYSTISLIRSNKTWRHI
ncbi:hypothetical protein [uncultured Winogradskyella sp.]|uniref:hypothetical protein n=1 Tax=uncultured Winogradskyella sp. TaxID=395353 RepID=UPI00263724B5|nr:hypothetical protein [uncultured Winogradskyella sp.]